MSRFYFPVFFLVAALLCRQVWAQDADDADDEDYHDSGADTGIVYTAGRTAEDASTVPATITVITAEQIAESGAKSVVEVLEKVPGVRFSAGQSGMNSETINMRGFGNNAFGRVLVLVDGNKVNNPDMNAINWTIVPLSDIDRIEVMDGSASVQYGNSAVGGVINIITKKGGAKRTFIGASLGSFWTHRETIAHFQPFSRGNFSVSAENVGTKGYRERQMSRLSNIALGSNIFLKDNLNLSLNGSFADFYFEFPGSLSKAEFEDDPRKVSASNSWDDDRTERHFSGGVGLQWFPLENVELNLPLSYRGKLINANTWSYSDRTYHSVEARPQGSVTFQPAGMDIRILGGLDVYYSRLKAEDYLEKARKTDAGDFSYFQWTIGPYLTARVSLLQNLTLSVGVRLDNAIMGAEKESATVDIDEKKTYTAFVYEAGVVFNPITDLKLYAKYASLFRYPFVDELAEITGWSVDHFNTDLDPEKGFNFELGISYQFWKILDANANFFFMRLKDEISYVSPVYDASWNIITPGYNANRDRTQRLGTNISLTLTPVELVSVITSYSFVNPIFISGDYDGSRIPEVPLHTFYAELKIKLPFVAGLTFGPNIEYVSRAYFSNDDANAQEMNDWRVLFGLQARYAFKTTEFSELAVLLNAKNLSNKSYASGGYTWRYPANGRSVDVALQYRF